MDNFIEIVKNKTNKELLKMVYEFDEWSPEMLLTVEEELGGRNILPNDIRSRKQQLIETEDAQLSAGKEASIIGLVIGWVTVFGLLGIFIGYHYSFSKIRNKYTGRQYFRYDENSRKNGSWLFYTSIILSTLGLLYKLLKGYSV
ncbi:MAG: hypothetical protein ABI863_12880 [Ginsengibacter sp.]